VKKLNAKSAVGTASVTVASFGLDLDTGAKGRKEASFLSGLGPWEPSAFNGLGFKQRID